MKGLLYALLNEDTEVQEGGAICLEQQLVTVKAGGGIGPRTREGISVSLPQACHLVLANMLGMKHIGCFIL